jgi:hypothetical protein
LLLPSYKPLKKLVPIALGDRCLRKLAFTNIKSSKTIVEAESENRKLSFLLNNYVRKSMPSVELCFW